MRRLEDASGLTVPVPIAEGVYVLAEPLDGRRLAVTVVVGEEGLLLVDTGLAPTPARLVVPALELLGFGPQHLRFIVITHSDIDHSGGLGAMLALAPRATAIAHRFDVPWIEDVERLINERYGSFAAEHAIDPDGEFLEWVRASDSRGVIHLAASGGELLRLGRQRQLELVHVPGHSRGHLAVIDHSTRTGVIGDAVFGSVTPGLDGRGLFAPGYYDASASRETIAVLRQLDLERLVGSHYPVIEGDEVEQFLAESDAFCDRLEQAVLEALASTPSPLTLLELIALVAPALRAWPEEADESLCAPVLGHLNELSGRGLLDRVAGAPVRWKTRG